MNQTYSPIHPQILRIDTGLTFDVFKKTGTDQFELLHPSGDVYTTAIHSSILKNSVPELYVKDSGIESYYNYLEKYCNIICNDPSVSAQSKALMAHELITFIARNLFENPGTEIITRYKKGFFF